MGRRKFKFSLWAPFRAIFNVLGKNWFQIVLVAFVVGTVFFLQRSIYADPAFLLRHIDIQTTGELKAEHILKWSGLSKGLNMFDINLDYVERNLTRRPQIKLVRVDRILPDRVRIFVSERRVFMRIAPRAANRKQYSLDSEGYVIPSTPEDFSPAVPLFVMPELQEEELHEGAHLATPRFPEFVKLIAAIQHAPILSITQLAYTEVNPDGYYTLYLASGLKILVPEENYEATFSKLQFFKDMIQNRTPETEYIDARFTDVVVKRKK